MGVLHQHSLEHPHIPPHPHHPPSYPPPPYPPNPPSLSRLIFQHFLKANAVGVLGEYPDSSDGLGNGRYSLRRDGASLDTLLSLCCTVDFRGMPTHSAEEERGERYQ